MSSVQAQSLVFLHLQSFTFLAAMGRFCSQASSNARNFPSREAVAGSVAPTLD